MVDTDAAVLQEALLDTLKAKGAVHSQLVEEAFRLVPRHVFLPGVPLETVYRDTHIPVHDEAGRQSTVSSQPSFMARMLEQLRVEPGHRVLEIGTGTGYNAALLGAMVGSDGHVVTLEIDGELILSARERLAAAGAENVTVLHTDGAEGYAPSMPYDRIIVTVAVWSIAATWLGQLQRTGLLLLPLTLLPGLECLTCFGHQGNHLSSVSPPAYCQFIGGEGFLCALHSAAEDPNAGETWLVIDHLYRMGPPHRVEAHPASCYRSRTSRDWILRREHLDFVLRWQGAKTASGIPALPSLRALIMWPCG